MKRVVSVSLGSSRRDHAAEHEFGGEIFRIERIGTDGNKRRAVEIIRSLDGKVDAFGMGGTDLYIYAGGRRYTFRESQAIAAAAQQTPIVDGSGIKNTLERRIVKQLEEQHLYSFAGANVLMVCAVDRFGMAEALTAAGAKLVMGDLMFGLNLPIPIRSLDGLSHLANIVAPVITKLPVSWFYPTGNEQTETKPRFERFFREAKVIAGDFHFIRRYMPTELPGKTIITNTVTAEDVNLLRDRGVELLITTTPEISGRSFGTNTLEAVLVSLSGRKPEQLTAADYDVLLDQIGVLPRIERLQTERGA